MTDPITIGAVLNSLKAAMDIGKGLRESTVTMKDADTNFKLAEMLGAVSAAKIQLSEIQVDMLEKEKRITELEAALEASSSVTRDGDAVYFLDAEGRPVGEPRCLRCWEEDHKLRQLTMLMDNHRIRTCPTCKTQYAGYMTKPLQPGYTNQSQT